MNKLLKQAFTLIELLVVIAIIGILSGLIIVGMNGMTQKATIAKAQVFSNSLRNSLMMNLTYEWKFDGSGVADGGSATTAYTKDTWSNTTGTIVGNPLVRSGDNCLRNSCLDFNGSADYITIGSNVTIDLNNGYTIEAWANHRTTSGYNRGIMTRRGTDDTGWFLFSYRNFNDVNDYIYNYVEYTNSSNATASTLPGTYIKSNQWNHLALTVGSDGVSKYYVNGILKDTRNPTNFVKLGGKDATNTTSLYISGPDWKMDGLLDDIRLYRVAISTSQIKEQYYLGLNKLLVNGEITDKDYQNGISGLMSAKR